MPNNKLIKIDLAALERSNFAREEWMARRDSLLEELSDIEKVESDSEFVVAGKLQTSASKHLKTLDDLRSEAKRPLLDAGKIIDNQAKALRLELEAQVARLKKLNGEYATKKAAEAEAERQRLIEQEAERMLAMQLQKTFGGIPIGVQDPDETVKIDVPSSRVNTGSNTMVEVWDFEIVDKSKVPLEFMIVDVSRIREYIKYKKSLEDVPSIPGVKFTKLVDVRSR